MKHAIRRQLLSLVQKTPFENLVKDLLLYLSFSRGATYDRQTFAVMQRCLNIDSNCIDVGAYRGDILRRILKYAPAGQVHAMEPVRENFEFLRRRFPSAHLHNVALSDRTGTAVFYHVLGRPARSGLQKQRYPDPDEQVMEVEVPLNTLDNLIPASLPIAFIKIDVEGAELNVLRGGLELIRKWRPVMVFEHAEEAARKFNASSEQLRAFLMEDCGMHLSTMRRWLQKEPPFSAEQFHAAREELGEIYFIAY